jgi:carboxyl-terminal processing protease
MSSRSRLVVLLISGPVIAFALIGGALSNASARDDTYQPLQMFQDVVSLILNNYVEKVNVDDVMDGAMRGLADGLDSDSSYLSPAEVQAVEAGTPLPPAGVGLTITRQYYLRIVAARDGSPAAQGGLATGDYIRDIDGKPTREMSEWEGVRALRGEPETKVTLTVIRGNAADPHDITLTRRVEDSPAVTGRIAAPGVGYVRIDDFDRDVAAQVAHQVDALKKAGATRLAIDVRHSASGAIENGLAVARLFVASGTLALKESRGAPQEVIAAAAGDGQITMPAVLLIDAGTGGPAELFAAALDANHRARLVGERTDGHGAEQTLVKLQDGAGLWLSTKQYLTPAGAVIEDKGIAPDVEVDEPMVDFGEIPPSTDPILEKALALLAPSAAA